MDEIDRLAEFSPDFAGVLDDVAGALHRIQLRQLVATHASDDRGDDAAVAALAESIPAEEVQLMYQIAINGRRDIALAPTPRAGFEMTLLRMLAFRPAQGDVAPPRTEAAKSAVSRTASPTRTAAIVETARVPDPPKVAKTKVAPKIEVAAASNELFDCASFNGDWSSLIKQAGLGGPTGELARNSALIGIDNGVVRLSLKEGHGDLAAAPLVANMAEKLSIALGRQVKVKYETAAVVVETPADASERERAARQRSAEQAIDADSFVQAAIRDFGAHVIPGSVKPVASAPSTEK
jgi:DNA polymerase-3 subunit gamma/tau